MKQVVVFLADGFEECEALASIDLLRRAEIGVTTASIMGRKEVNAAHKVVILADELAENIDFSKIDMIILPGGGGGTQLLSESELVKEQCIAFARDKHVAAICAAPTVLGKCGLLNGKRATCYPGMEAGMIGATAVDERVVTDGNIITGIGPGAAFLFALELIRYLLGEEAYNKIKNEIVL